MITGFNASSTEPDVQLRAYVIAAQGNRDDAIQSAAARFLRSEVEGHKDQWCPTAAEFAKECRSEHTRLIAIENKQRGYLPPPNRPIDHQFKDMRIIQRIAADKLAERGFVCTPEVGPEESRKPHRWKPGSIWFWCLQEVWSPTGDVIK